MVARGPPKTEVEGSSPLRVVFFALEVCFLIFYLFGVFLGGFADVLKYA
jgi:hypothetical protein